MMRYAAAVLLWLLFAMAGAWASCPATPTDCGSTTMNNLTVGGAATIANGNAISSTATGGTKSRTLSDHFADVVQVKDFGTNPAAAVCNGTSSSDDGAAFNAAIAFAKATYSQGGNPHAMIRFPPGSCYIATTMDMTGVQGDNRLAVVAYGTQFLINTTGMPGVDFTGSQNWSWFGGHFSGSATNIPTTAMRMGRGCPAGTNCQGGNSHVSDVIVDGSFSVAGCYVNQAEQTLLNHISCNSNYPTAAQLIADPTAHGAAGMIDDGYSHFWASVPTVLAGATNPGIGSNVGLTVAGGSRFSASGTNASFPSTGLWIGNTYGHTFTGANYAVTSGSVGGPPITLYDEASGVNYNLHLGDLHKEQPSSTFPAILFTGPRATQTYYGMTTNDESCCGGFTSAYFGTDTGVTTVSLYGTDLNIGNPNGFTGVFLDPTKFNFSGRVSLGTDIGGTTWNLACGSGVGAAAAVGVIKTFAGVMSACIDVIAMFNQASNDALITMGSNSAQVTGDRIAVTAAINQNMGMTLRNGSALGGASSEIRLGNATDNFQTRLQLNGTGNNNFNGAGTTRLLGAGGLFLESGTTLPVTVPTNALIVGSTKFTTSGCSISATTGSGTAGTYTSGTTGTCTAVITVNGATGMTAPHGWVCSAFDRTTPADAQLQTASTATTATIAGTTVTGDVVAFSCSPY